MKLNFIEKLAGSVFFTGFSPVAPGTVSSFVALLFYLIPGFENPTFMLAVISVFTVWGIRLGNKFEKKYGKDPSQCTIDEFVGTWISLLFVPKVYWILAIDFVIWRLLDIIKPFPARTLEKLKGGKGIMLDDIVSGAYSLIIIHIFISFL